MDRLYREVEHDHAGDERIRQARNLLEDTNLPVDAVARPFGFGEAVNLPKHFQRAVGLSPSSYRAWFDARART